MENPIKMDDLGVPLFSETSISGFPATAYVNLPGRCIHKLELIVASQTASQKHRQSQDRILVGG